MDFHFKSDSLLLDYKSDNSYLSTSSEVFENSNDQIPDTSDYIELRPSISTQCNVGKSYHLHEQSRCENKRGRPKAAVIGNLMLEGSNSASVIKCKFCCRVFPREKSLQAHLRTHTGKSFTSL